MGFIGIVLQKDGWNSWGEGGARLPVPLSLVCKPALFTAIRLRDSGLCLGGKRVGRLCLKSY